MIEQIAKLEIAKENLQQQINVIDEVIFKLEMQNKPEDERIETNSLRTMKKIIDCACEAFNYTRQELLAKDRSREKVDIRHMVMSFGLKHTELTLKQIGEQMGGRDHTTVLHSKAAHDDLMETNENYQSIYSEFKQLLIKKNIIKSQN